MDRTGEVLVHCPSVLFIINNSSSNSNKNSKTDHAGEEFVHLEAALRHRRHVRLDLGPPAPALEGEIERRMQTDARGE